jgi:hypothetical protein
MADVLRAVWKLVFDVLLFWQIVRFFPSGAIVGWDADIQSRDLSGG